MTTTLPTDSAARKEYSLSSGCYAYFPAALAGVARHSFKAGAKHTAGVLEHRRWLSTDHSDCIERHMMDLRDMLAGIERLAVRGLKPMLTEVLLSEANALAWRALALSQELHEKYGGAPLAPAARLAPAEGTVPGVFLKPLSEDERLSLIERLTEDKNAGITHIAADESALFRQKSNVQMPGGVTSQAQTSEKEMAGPRCAWCLARPGDTHAMHCPGDDIKPQRELSAGLTD